MKIIKKTAAATLSVALALACGPLAAYAGAGAEFFGDVGAPWSYVDVTVIGGVNDLFGDIAKELAPGDERALTVQLRNRSSAEAVFSLKASALTGEAAEALEGVYAGKSAMDVLLDAVTAEITYSGGVIYDGPLRGSSSAPLYGTDGVILGSLGAGSYGTIGVTLRVPGNLDNSYMDSLCAVEWVFAASQEDSSPVTPPTTPTTPSVPGSGTGTIPGTTPGADISDEPTPLDEGPVSGADDIYGEDVPLGDKPDLVVVVDDPTPMGLPQTGGLMTFATPAAIALIVLLAMFAMTFVGKRKKERDGAAGPAEPAIGVPGRIQARTAPDA
jgi:hypothetical protein